MATRAIDKGMPIEQVQKILGHSQIDTTMRYALVNQNNVKSVGFWVTIGNVALTAANFIATLSR